MSTLPTASGSTRNESDVACEIAARATALDQIEERRRWPRGCRPITATLRALSGVEIAACPTDNVSEGGLRLTVPVGFGLGVGQRYEVLLHEAAANGHPDDLVSEGHYGTVVRTEIMLANEGQGDRVGIGLCFDTPIAF
jgi:hypothetical protein